MNDKDHIVIWLLITVVICITLLSFVNLVSKTASQHGANNRALIQHCIEAGKHPAIGRYGELAGCL